MSGAEGAETGLPETNPEQFFEQLRSDDLAVASAFVETQWQQQLPWILNLLDGRCRCATLQDAMADILGAVHDAIFTVDVLRAKSETFDVTKGSWSNYLRWAIQQQVSSEIRRLKLSQRLSGSDLAIDVSAQSVAAPTEGFSRLESRITTLSTSLRAVWTLRMALDREQTEPDRNAMVDYSGRPKQPLEEDARAMLAKVEGRRQQRSIELEEVVTGAKETQLARSYARSRWLRTALETAGASTLDLEAIQSAAADWTQETAKSAWRPVVTRVPAAGLERLADQLEEFAVVSQRIAKLQQELSNAVELRRKLAGAILPEHEEVAGVLHKTKSTCEKAFSRANRALFQP